ncbi:hypothetical protein PRUPE_7G037100 [Prunus persica]|uniref:DUF4219 domain-containing protein n=1 Tax=Prunus persica TaxID=3760 RepID=M5VVA9_PRUPE|nr:hypothetical protein PRUPE_7G037100 [Prunus persica]
MVSELVPINLGRRFILVLHNSSYNSLPLPIFTRENYDFWNIKMKTYFMSQENSTVQQLRQLKKDQQKDAKALLSFQQALHDTIFPRIMGATTAKKAWNTLKEEFQGNVKAHAVKLQTLRRDFENIKMKGSETTQDYYAKLKEIVNQLRAYGAKY